MINYYYQCCFAENDCQHNFSEGDLTYTVICEGNCKNIRADTVAMVQDVTITISAGAST